MDNVDRFTKGARLRDKEGNVITIIEQMIINGERSILYQKKGERGIFQTPFEVIYREWHHGDTVFIDEEGNEIE